MSYWEEKSGRLRVHRSWTVYCATCSDLLDLHPLGETRHGAEREARGQGWILRKGKWTCPDCAESKEKA